MHFFVVFKIIFMGNKEFFKKSQTSVKDLIWGMAAYTSSSILGPLLAFGGLGFLLDKWTKKGPLFLLLGVLVAFITTNFLIYKKVRKMTEEFEEYDRKNKEAENELEDSKKKK